jgi:hypothetical protein
MMADAATFPRRCAVCGKHMEATDRIVGVPDLMVEMHEACYRRSLESKKPTSPKVPE